MNYLWDKLLAPEEKLQKEFTISSRYRTIIVSLIAVGGIIICFQSIFAGILFFLLDSLYWWYLKTAKHYAFTNKRIILVESFINKNIMSISYDQLTDTEVDQNIFDQLGGWGTIILDTAGTHVPQVHLSFIDDPHSIKKTLDQIAQSSRGIPYSKI